MALDHERVLIVRGERSGLTIIIALHSTTLGPAGGGCRMWQYDTWHDGLADALRLSEAMTLKAALAGLPLGGGKAVIVLERDVELTTQRRRDVMLDLGDVVDTFDGRYVVGEDVGVTAEDMLVARERTMHAHCLPTNQGGTGETGDPTALGMHLSLNVLGQRLYGAPTLSGRIITIVGLGQVGGRLARRLADDGARLVVSDIDASKKSFAADVGATWVEPAEAYATPCDVLVPAALGGVITQDLVPHLRCDAICGPANNQLASREIADELLARGIVWAPDFLVNAGGVIQGVLADLHGRPAEEVTERVRQIPATLNAVLDTATAQGTTPLVAATTVAQTRINNARANA